MIDSIYYCREDIKKMYQISPSASVLLESVYAVQSKKMDVCLFTDYSFFEYQNIA